VPSVVRRGNSTALMMRMTPMATLSCSPSLVTKAASTGVSAVSSSLKPDTVVTLVVVLVLKVMRSPLQVGQGVAHKGVMWSFRSSSIKQGGRPAQHPRVHCSPGRHPGVRWNRRGSAWVPGSAQPHTQQGAGMTASAQGQCTSAPGHQGMRLAGRTRGRAGMHAGAQRLGTGSTTNEENQGGRRTHEARMVG